MNDSRSAFILALLRELRAPLVDVLGHARHAPSDPSPTRALEGLREIEKAAAELTALIDDTADFVAAGRAPSRGPMQRIDLRLAAQRACDALARRAQASGVDLSCPPPAAGLIVMADPDGNEFPNRGVYLEVVPNEKIVFTDAFVEAWQPSEKPFFTGVLTFTNSDGKTIYHARALHWTKEACDEHETMGFHDGWKAATLQLAELLKRI